MRGALDDDSMMMGKTCDVGESRQHRGNRSGESESLDDRICKGKSSDDGEF